MSNTDPSATKLTARFLRSSEPTPGSKRYTLGVFESGITIYKQQIRALNLIHCLKMEYPKEKLKIAVIGGGIAGLTAAAAAATLGMSVSLFERKPTLLHLQRGCDTRWVHPQIYDWPQDGSTLPYAGLPLLTWEESTAGDVARQILDRFQRDFYDDIVIHCNAEILEVSNDNRVSWRGSSKKYEQDGDVQYDGIIFAVGFGIERHSEEWQDSYWRNDSINQLSTALGDDPPKILISGCGDGGLTDLLRACIQDFHQARIVREFFPPEKSELYDGLRAIVRNFHKGDSKKTSSWLYDQFTAIYTGSNLLDYIKRTIDVRKRVDHQVVFNARPMEMRNVLSLEKASLLNTLLAFLVHKVGGFKYVGGKCVATRETVQIDGTTCECSRKSIRHGTDRKRVLREAHFTEAEKRFGALVDNLGVDTSIPLWQPGWWGKASGGDSVEFVPPATQLVATTFISTLGDVLKRFFDGYAYRLTLHRLVYLQGGDYFQQICRYSGTKKEGTVGRVNTVEEGIVGLACRLGMPVMVQGDDVDELDKAVAALGAEKLGSDPLGALFAVPFIHEATAGRVVPLVLFLDTAKRVGFGDDNQFLRVLYDACRGFCDNIHTMKNRDELYFPNSEYPGYVCTQKPSDARLINEHSALKRPETLEDVFEQSLRMDGVPIFNADFRRY